LIKGLEAVIPPEQMIEIQLLFKGHNVEHICENLFADPSSALSIIRMDPLEVLFVKEQFEKKYGLPLLTHIDNTYPPDAPSSARERAYALLFALAPLAADARQTCVQCADNAFQEEALLTILERCAHDILAFESCYNLYYSD